MIRPGRFFKQIARHIAREKRLSLGSFLVLVIVLSLIDLFWIASINITAQYEQLLRTVRMEIFLSDAVPESALPAVEKAILSFNEIDTVSFISKDEAALILKNELGPGILDGLEANPLPRSYIVFFNRSLNLDALDNFESRLMRLEGVDAVEFGRPWIEKVENIGHSLHKVGYLVGGVILFVVLLTMANTNRLTARTKSRDFFQLKLLGAGPSYLLYPFLAEGFLAAVVAAGLGWGILYYLSQQISFSAFVLLLPDWRAIVVYSLLAGVTGIIGAYLGIRRLLIS